MKEARAICSCWHRGRSPPFLRMNSGPFSSIGLLTMSGRCVEFCLEGSISLLHAVCSSVRVCSSSLLQHSQFSSKIKSVITGAKWYTTKWSRTLLLLSKSSALSLCSPPPVGLKSKFICSDVSHIHVDSSANFDLKVIAAPTLSVVTVVSSPCCKACRLFCQHTSDLRERDNVVYWKTKRKINDDLQWYLRSALVKIMPISGCCGVWFIVRLPPLHAKHLPPPPSCILW